MRAYPDERRPHALRERRSCRALVCVYLSTRNDRGFGVEPHDEGLADDQPTFDHRDGERDQVVSTASTDNAGESSTANGVVEVSPVPGLLGGGQVPPGFSSR